MAKKNKFAFFVDHIIVFILLFSVFAFIWPSAFGWMTNYTSVFLGIAMFGMGTTIEFANFKEVLAKPREILIGVLCQFLIMPILAYALCRIFNLPRDISLGVILVGSSPGGTASNVITHIAGGDVPLSVSMTTISTLLSPLLTPLLVHKLAGAWIEVSFFAMFMTTVKVILIPVLLGILINRIFEDEMEKISPYMPLVSSIAIVLIISGIVAINSDKILESGKLVLIVVFMHNVFGLLAGLLICKLFGVERDKATAISIEIGMQNSGLAVSLAMANFANNPLASLPGAIFSVVQNLTGSIFANIRRNRA